MTPKRSSNRQVYKSFVMQHSGEFWIFYNAKDGQSNWHERIGLARSRDLISWRRYDGNPVLDNGPAGAWDSRFVGDPYIMLIDGVWHMFYYGFDGTHARDGVAKSYDLLHWEKSPHNPILACGGEGDFDSTHACKPSVFYDSKYAHKPSILRREGIYYHFYTAVAKRMDGGEHRAIALATSKPLRL
ncbi:MAG: hypothetical protein ACUVXI_03960 [bacterium]